MRAPASAMCLNNLAIGSLTIVRWSAVYIGSSHRRDKRGSKTPKVTWNVTYFPRMTKVSPSDTFLSLQLPSVLIVITLETPEAVGTAYRIVSYRIVVLHFLAALLHNTTPPLTTILLSPPRLSLVLSSSLTLHNLTAYPLCRPVNQPPAIWPSTPSISPHNSLPPQSLRSPTEARRMILQRNTSQKAK